MGTDRRITALHHNSLGRIAICFLAIYFISTCSAFAHQSTTTPTAPSTDTTRFFQAFEAEPSGLTPKQVMRRSMILPGWGQVTNAQGWKVPLFAGLFTGTALLTSQLTKDYHDYRAAAYNIAYGADSDFKFGPTPSSIPESANLGQVQQLRDQTRNRRDLAILSIVLVWGLNVVDSYVYAHMATFDVSDNLQASITPSLTPSTYTRAIPSQPMPAEASSFSQYTPSLTFTLHFK